MNIAVITGASSGLGKEYVSAVAQTRKDLDEIWIIARRRERLEELHQKYGDKIRVFPADLAEEDSMEYIRKQFVEKDATVRLLINNAGFGRLGDFDQMNPEDDRGMVRLNCEALTVLTSVCLPFMKENGEIINTCSIAAFAPNARMAVYCSTKSYVMSFSRCLRYELKKRKINVLAVCPGPMDTEFLPVAGIEKGSSKTFDRLPRVEPSGIARRSLAASKKKRGVYTDRFFYKFYRFVAKILPHSLVMKMSAA